MNKLLVAASLLCTQMVLAQEPAKPRTLLGNDPIRWKDLGIYVAGGLGSTKLDGRSALLAQFRSGLSIKKNFSLGAFYQQSVNNVIPQSETLQNVYLDYRVTGGFIELTAFSDNLLHLSFPILLGYGEVEMDSEFQSPRLGEANFVQVEPSALLELNLQKYVRVYAGAGYRWLSNLNYRNFDQSALTGWHVQAGLKLGLFR
jgi:hypothetical protein